MQDSRDAGAPAATGGLGFNDLLNILWRWKWLTLLGVVGGAVTGILYGLLVTPLHRASVTVEPGITYFDNQGLPVREWEVQDIVQWYRRGDYNPSVAIEMEEDPREFLPIIRASFIPRSPQSRGGRTISLSTMAPTPEQGRRILASSVHVFNAFAEADTVTANIALMRVRIRANIAREEGKVEDVETQRSRLDLQIEAARADIQTAQDQRALLQERLAEARASKASVDSTLALYLEMIATVEGGVTDLRAQLLRWSQRADDLVNQMGQDRSDDTTIAALLRSELAELVGTVGELQLGVLDQDERLLSWRGHLQELRRQSANWSVQIEEARFAIDSDLPRRILDLEQRITEFELQRDRDLARVELEHREELGTMHSRLASLKPLQMNGDPFATARPVRPRKMRATLILVSLGLVAGLTGSFVLEYLSRNWREITRAPAHKA